MLQYPAPSPPSYAAGSKQSMQVYSRLAEIMSEMPLPDEKAVNESKKHGDLAWVHHSLSHQMHTSLKPLKQGVVAGL